MVMPEFFKLQLDIGMNEYARFKKKALFCKMPEKNTFNNLMIFLIRAFQSQLNQ